MSPPNDERRPCQGAGSSSSVTDQGQRTAGSRQNPADATEPLELFGVVRSPSPPDVPTRVTFAVRDGDELHHVRGAGPRPPTSGPQDAGAPLYWQTEARRIVLALVSAGHLVSSDDLHDRFADEPSATGAAFGALFKSMAKQGLLRLVEHRPSRRPEARGRVVGLWATGASLGRSA